MPLITIQYSDLTRDQKARIGQKVIDAFAEEGIAIPSIFLMFRQERLEFMTDGGYPIVDQVLPEVAVAPAPVPIPVPEPVPAPAPVAVQAEEPAPRRQPRPDMDALREELIKRFQQTPDMNSFDIQQALGLKHLKNAGTIVRDLIDELHARGQVNKTGQKRGTRYHFIFEARPGHPGQPDLGVSSAEAILQKAEETPADEA